MLTCYFGVPGCGKTTLMTQFAQRELKLIRKGKSKYERVYTNFQCTGCNMITFKDLETYKINNALIIIDEITLDADNRHFKSFKDSARNFFVLHRHLNCDIIYATQSFEMVDLKIRQLTQELWYMSKSVVPFFDRFTSAKRIYRNININEYTSELTLGYRFCNLLESIFVNNYRLCYRPKYYKYFDSFDEDVLASRPVLESITWDTKNMHSLFADISVEDRNIHKNESPSDSAVGSDSPTFIQNVQKKSNFPIPKRT